MSYVDGFILAVPKHKLGEYIKVAEFAADLWREYGALEYRECVADDVKVGEVTSFPRAVLAEPNETVIFSYITYHSREHRDEVNKKVMEDPRMKDFDPKDMPADMKRMIMGGFKTVIQRR